MTGTVSDPGGAVIPDAKVVVKNLGTNVEYRTQTTSAGLYVLPNLPAGTYSLSLEMTGFQKYLRSPVQISQGTTLGLNVVLQVGRVTETVEVTAAAAQLQTASSEVSHQVSPKFIQELPLVGGGEARDTEAFMFLLPGVSGNSWQAHINGGQAFTKEITVDGVSNNLSTVQGSFFESAPPYEAMAEFKLDVSNYSAEYGSAQAGMTQFQMKSGTNNFHGSVFNSVGNDILNANDILSNSGRSGQPPDAQGNAFQPATRSWTIGLSAGGPLSIPRVYSGRDKTFIFSAFEGATFRQGVFGSLETYPVQSLLQGDFSSLLGASVGTDCLGRTVLRGQIYDPSTTRLCPDGVTFVRDPFINNQVPIASTIARNLITEMPVIGGPQTRNNFPGGGGQPFRNIAHWLIKADHSISDRQKVIGSYNYAWRKRKHASGSLDDEHLITRWTDQTVRTQNARFVYDFTLRPNLLNHFTLGYSRFTNPHFVASIGKDISRLGFKGLPRLDLGLPEINFSGGSVAYSSLGRGGPRDDLVENNFSFSDNLAWIKGRHSLKIGLEYRASQLNDTNFGDSNGSFNFRPFQTRLPGFAATGDPFASFLLGEVNSFGLPEPREASPRRKRYSWFVQDDIKVTRKLTLNIGLRHDIQLPTLDAHDRFESFVPSLPNPGAPGRLGAMAFAGRDGQGRRFSETRYKSFGPRFGFAYAMTEKTVLRGAYGMFQGGSGFDDFVGIFNPDFFGSISCPSVGDQRSSVFFLDNGPPASCTIPTLQTPTIRNGQAMNGFPPGHFPKNGGLLPYVQQWSFAIERQLTANTILKTAYVGSKGTHLHNEAIGFINQLDPSFVRLGGLLTNVIGASAIQALPEVQSFPVDPATGNRSPYPGFEAFYGGGATLAQALRPFPQYLDIGTHNDPIGNSNYHSFQLSATKRLSQGLSFIAAYTISKTISDSEQNLSGFNSYWSDPATNLGYNSYDRRSERSVTTYDQPQILAISATYELPWGSGRRWLNSGIASHILGGWQIAGIAKYASGFPIAINQFDNFSGTPIFNWLGEAAIGRPNVIPGVPLKNPNYDGKYETPYINNKAFGDVFGTFGSAPRQLSGLREPGQLREDLSVLKNIRITEKVRFQFRTEFFNAFNRHRFRPSSLNYSDTFVYGASDPFCGCTLSNLADSPREIQFSARIDW